VDDDDGLARRVVRRIARVRREAILLAGGLVVLAGWLASIAGWVSWPVVGAWVLARTGLIVSLLFAIGLLAAGGWSLWKRDRMPGDRGRPRPALSWWVVVAALFVVAVVSWATTTWLLHEANLANDVHATRVEAIKTGLTIGAGTGGVFALLLAVRRQWHQELTAQDTVLDATERRVTELYTKAVEQLGSEKAPVRLGGLYALERLAQANPTQRQTVINVLCAYLRMPFEPPGDPAPRKEGARSNAAPDDPAAAEAPGGESTVPTAPDQATGDWERRTQELQVRLTAQRILTNHLRPGPDQQRPVATFWSNSDLDLAGAMLIDLDLSDCHPREAQFDGASFAGRALFRGAWFAEAAWFDGASFAGNAYFNSARFAGHAAFNRASFAGDARFDQASFAEGAMFNGASFAEDAWFNQASFAGDAWFSGASFAEIARFDQASFAGDTLFSEANFAEDALFIRASFAGGAQFNGANFAEGAQFNGANFAEDALFIRASFAGAHFNQASFAGDTRFDQASFAEDAMFNGASFAAASQASLPPGLKLGPPDDDGWRVARLVEEADERVDNASEPGDTAPGGDEHSAGTPPPSEDQSQ
jgi:uncharacterized membrane protein YidH (DUF202 family)